MSNTTTVAPATSYFASVLPQMRLVNQQMLYWVPLVVLIPGLVFNIFMAGVFMRARFWRNTTMGFYYTMHAVFSSICLVSGSISFFSTIIITSGFKLGSGNSRVPFDFTRNQLYTRSSVM